MDETARCTTLSRMDETATLGCSQLSKPQPIESEDCGARSPQSDGTKSFESSSHISSLKLSSPPSTPALPAPASGPGSAPAAWAAAGPAASTTRSKTRSSLPGL